MLKELVNKVPRKNVFAGAAVHQGGSFFKHHILGAQNQVIPTCHKSSRGGRRLPWLNRDPLLEIRQKRKVYAQWKQGQVTWKKYRDAACHCREKNRASKAQLELKLARTLADIKKEFFSSILMATGSVKITSAHFRMRMTTSQRGTWTRQR